MQINLTLISAVAGTQNMGEYRSLILSKSILRPFPFPSNLSTIQIARFFFTPHSPTLFIPSEISIEALPLDPLPHHHHHPPLLLILCQVQLEAEEANYEESLPQPLAADVLAVHTHIYTEAPHTHTHRTH